MNFNLLFTLVGNLSFVLEFEILPIEHQDFLFFEGENASAHMYRKNQTVFLQVNTETYRSIISDTLQFSWEGFRINGTEMEKIRSGENVKLEFDTFTFLSPILSLNMEQPEENAIFNKILGSNKVNYYYILTIVLLVALLVDLKPRSFGLIRDLFSKKESEYEVMKPIGPRTTY
tara:strand:+ start:139 stop:660 length:522 start_codon:yes stop_codon:yes gene_type:complete